MPRQNRSDRRSPAYIVTYLLVLAIALVARTCKHGRFHDLVRLFQPPRADSARRAIAVPIEHVEAGDRVLARDPRTGKATVATVTARTVRKVAVLRVLELESLQDRALVVIRTTDDHRFWVPRLRTWIPAGDLKAGTLLGTGEQPTYRLLATRAERLEKPVRVYNLVVPGPHSYFLAAGGKPAILVHNLDCVPPPVDAASWQPDHMSPIYQNLPPIDPPPTVHPPAPQAFSVAAGNETPVPDLSRHKLSLERLKQEALVLLKALSDAAQEGTAETAAR